MEPVLSVPIKYMAASLRGVMVTMFLLRIWQQWDLGGMQGGKKMKNISKASKDPEVQAQMILDNPAVMAGNL